MPAVPALFGPLQPILRLPSLNMVLPAAAGLASALVTFHLLWISLNPVRSQSLLCAFHGSGAR